MKNGFVLAELLVVLVIIAVLSIIAIPNFLEAEMRSNVARARSDMRTVATALEAYALDNNEKYPSDAGNGAGGVWRPYGNVTVAEPRASFTVGYELTTPIAYLSSSAQLRDPFRWSYTFNPITSGREGFALMNIDLRQELNPFTSIYALHRSRLGSWVMFSAGPDKFFNNTPSGGDYSSLNIPRYRNYDPTNGTVSNGDIYRSHAHPDGAPEVAGTL